MSVIRRCPSCGTAQATSGDCEACHEAQVRYYCTNHTPGVWLDGTSCPHCGSRLGATREKSTAPPPPVRRPAPPPVATRMRSPVSTPPPRATPPFAPSAPPPRATPPFVPAAPPLASIPSDPRTIASTEEAVEADAAPLSPLQRLLEAALHVNAAKRTRDRKAAGMARNLPGCLLRLLVIAIVLFLALVAALFMFGSALLRGTAPY